MNRESETKVLLLATFAGAGLVYGLTAAHGYPWSASTHWALAWSGVLGELPRMAHPVWGYFVRVFGGHYIAMSVTFAALAAALLAAVATRHCGWRVGTATALVAIFAPIQWNAAVTGGMRSAQLLVAVLVLAALDVLGVVAWRWLRKLRAANQVRGQTVAVRAAGGKWPRLVAWALLGAAVIFMLASLTFHDYAIGEDASAYVNEVLKDAQGKWVVMSGVADDQFQAAVRDGRLEVVLVSLRRDDINRRNLIGRVRMAFPNEPELAAAAEIGPREFVKVACRAHPDRLVMTDMERTRQAVEQGGRKDLRRRRELPVAKLVEWNNEMVRAMDAGEVSQAGAIAREILSQPQWRGFVPANAVLGTLSGMEGDYLASERFFRTVFASELEPPAVAYNDFAETLRQLKRYDEAERFARTAVAKSGPRGWRERLTLIQILKETKPGDRGIRALAAEALASAPEPVRARLREWAAQ